MPTYPEKTVLTLPLRNDTVAELRKRKRESGLPLGVQIEQALREAWKI